MTTLGFLSRLTEPGDFSDCQNKLAAVFFRGVSIFVATKMGISSQNMIFSMTETVFVPKPDQNLRRALSQQ